MMKGAILFVLLALAAFHAEAKKSHKHETEKESKDVEAPEEESEFPGFALRIPIPNFGALTRMKEQLENLFTGQKPKDLALGDDTKTKTTTKTKNSTHGPFKTFSVTSETVSTDNKTSPKILSKIYKSITTLDKDKLPKGKNGKIKLPGMEFDFGPFGPQFNDIDGEVGSTEKERCTESSQCKDGQYCDAFFGACKIRLEPGDACTQKDQCDSKAGRYRCTWGRCILNSEEGSAGTFCDADNECHSKEEELGCQEQADISRFAHVCMAKLGEGATCGRASIFDLFRKSDDLSNKCKKGLQCKTVGFFGRKACIHDSVDVSEETGHGVVEDQVSKHEHVTKKHKEEDKSKKLKF